MSFIYLASPYTSHDPAIEHERFLQTEAFVAQHLEQSFHMYSPIVHCHELARKYSLPRDADFWRRYNFSILSCASSLWVLELPGWEFSRGISAETAFARECSIPIHNITPVYSSEFAARNLDRTG